MKQVLEYYKFENPKSMMSALGSYVKKGILTKIGIERYKHSRGTMKCSTKYMWIHPYSTPIEPTVEVIKSAEVSDDFVDECHSKMRKELVNKLAPLLCVKKELGSAKSEIKELLDEVAGLRAEIERKNLIINTFPIKLEEQSEKIILDFAKFFECTKEMVVDILNENTR